MQLRREAGGNAHLTTVNLFALITSQDLTWLI